MEHRDATNHHTVQKSEKKVQGKLSQGQVTSEKIELKCGSWKIKVGNQSGVGEFEGE